jgi:dipeptidyl aminopeptidase/acylaminoacyl peptidase
MRARAIVFLSVVVVFSAYVILSRPISAYSQQVEPLPVEETLSMRTFAAYMHVVFSPNSEWVAYTLQDNRRKEPQGDERYRVFTRTGAYWHGLGGDIWITNTKTGLSRNLTGGQGNNWSPAWSPDGRYIAFYSDRGGQANVWVCEMPTGKLRQVPNVIARSLADPIQWTPDARQVVVKLLPEGMTIEEAANLETGERPRHERKPDKSTVIVYSSPKASNQGGSTESGTVNQQAPAWSLTALHLADLAAIDVDSGKTERLVRGSRIAKFWLSPDGSSIAYTMPQKFEAAGSQQILFDLAVYSFSAGQARVVAPHIQLDYDGSSVSWSPRGKTLGYRTGGALAKSSIFIVSATGGEVRNLTTALHPNFANSGFQPPLWDAAGQNIYFIGDNALWKASLVEGRATEIAKIPHRRTEVITLRGGNRLWSPDGGKSTIVSVRDDETKRVGFHKIDLRTGQSSMLLEESKSYYYPLVYGLAVSDDGKHVVYPAQDTQHGQDLWLADPEFRNLKRMTQINPQLERYNMGSARLIEWHSLDGERLRGALLLPAGYQEGKRYPLIVKVYGGASLSANLNLFGFANAPADNLQLLATRGYAILLPDTKRRTGTPMADLMKTMLPGVNKVVEMGIADPDRLGLMGHSNGGYCALSLITQTTRFRAAMMSAGLGNLISYYGQLGKDGGAFGLTVGESSHMGRTLWNDRLGYIENSPVLFLDRVQTPLLIIHGGADDTVSPFLAGEVFVGLRRLGKEVVYAKYEDEGHWQGIWSYANQVDFVNRMVAWFDERLMKPVDASRRANTKE